MTTDRSILYPKLSHKVDWGLKAGSTSKNTRFRFIPYPSMKGGRPQPGFVVHVFGKKQKTFYPCCHTVDAHLEQAQFPDQRFEMAKTCLGCQKALQIYPSNLNGHPLKGHSLRFMASVIQRDSDHLPSNKDEFLSFDMKQLKLLWVHWYAICPALRDARDRCSSVKSGAYLDMSDKGQDVILHTHSLEVKGKLKLEIEFRATCQAHESFLGDPDFFRARLEGFKSSAGELYKVFYQFRQAAIDEADDFLLEKAKAKKSTKSYNKPKPACPYTPDEFYTGIVPDQVENIDLQALAADDIDPEDITAYTMMQTAPQVLKKSATIIPMQQEPKAVVTQSQEVMFDETPQLSADERFRIQLEWAKAEREKQEARRKGAVVGE